MDINQSFGLYPPGADLTGRDQTLRVGSIHQQYAAPPEKAVTSGRERAVTTGLVLAIMGGVALALYGIVAASQANSLEGALKGFGAAAAGAALTAIASWNLVSDQPSDLPPTPLIPGEDISPLIPGEDIY